MPLRKISKRTTKVNRYCPDCGGRLTYLPELSTPKMPNEYRILSYGCDFCNYNTEGDSWKIPKKIIQITRKASLEPYESVRISIEQTRTSNKRAKITKLHSKSYYENLKYKKLAKEAQKEHELEQKQALKISNY